jgi:hypothetical protein
MMDAEKLPGIVVLAIEPALASDRQLSWKVQEKSAGMLVQLVWKCSESRNLVWNKFCKKAPSRHACMHCVFSSLMQQSLLNRSTPLLRILLRNPVIRCHKICLLLRLLSSTHTTTCFSLEQQQSADEQVLLSPTIADIVDTKPVVLGKASFAMKGEELTVAEAHVHHGFDTT